MDGLTRIVWVIVYRTLTDVIILTSLYISRCQPWILPITTDGIISFKLTYCYNSSMAFELSFIRFPFFLLHRHNCELYENGQI